MTQESLQAQVQPWLALGLPLRRVEPQSFALIRALGLLHRPQSEADGVGSVASLWVDVLHHGVLALWLEPESRPHRYWERYLPPSPSQPTAAPALLNTGDECVQSPFGVEAEPMNALLRWVHDCAAASESATVRWCVRGEGCGARALQTHLPLVLDALRWSEHPQALEEQAWPMAAAAWGVAWVWDA